MNDETSKNNEWSIGVRFTVKSNGIISMATGAERLVKTASERFGAAKSVRLGAPGKGSTAPGPGSTVQH